MAAAYEDSLTLQENAEDIRNLYQEKDWLDPPKPQPQEYVFSFCKLLL